MIREAIILAAGEGKRLRPFTEDMPKVMLPIANKPILEYVINALAENKIDNIVIVVGYKKESIMSYFGNGSKWNINIEYAIQEKQLGTAHALLQAESFIKGNEFIVLPGDNVIDKESISRLISFSSPALIIEESEIPSKYGVIEMEENFIKKIVEKPKSAESNLISTGIYKFETNVFDLIKDCVKEGKNNLTDVVQKLIENDIKIYGIKGNGKWKDAVYPWNLLELNGEALRNLKAVTAGKIEENVVIKGNVVIGEDTTIHSGCYIKGPVVIGKGCEIGPNACIFPSSSIGDNVAIFPFCQIRNSIIMDDVSIGANSIISNSIIGKGSKISSHLSTIVGEAIVEIEDEFHRVGEIGTFVGSDCNIGANVIIEAGKIIGKKCSIGHNKIIDKNIPSMSKVI